MGRLVRHFHEGLVKHHSVEEGEDGDNGFHIVPFFYYKDTEFPLITGRGGAAGAALNTYMCPGSPPWGALPSISPPYVVPSYIWAV